MNNHGDHSHAREGHSHDFTSGTEAAHERKTLYVVILTAAMMVIEIAAGIAFNSMALLADGWHMATHAGALGVAVFAYHFARKQAHNPLFTFGTGKVTTLGGFASAVALGVIALLITIESILRLFGPLEIAFNEAIFVASIGLVVNLFSAFLLREHPHHHHHHEHGHDHHHDDHDHHHAHDYNLKAAYFHVIADALTSVTAIVALLFGKYLGWLWMDPAMGVVGSLVIAKWSAGLLKETGRILLDRMPDETLSRKITEAITRNAGDRIIDLHIWTIAPGKWSVILHVETATANTASYYRNLLSKIDDFAHVTVEVDECQRIQNRV